MTICFEIRRQISNSHLICLLIPLCLLSLICSFYKYEFGIYEELDREVGPGIKEQTK